MEDNMLNDFAEKLGFVKKKGNQINTDELKIRENTLYYTKSTNNKTALQISSIAQIDVGPAPKQKITYDIIFILIMGIVLFILKHFIFGFITFGTAIGLIYLTILINKKVGDDLIIYLNNGRYFLFNFKDKIFLNNVFEVLMDCINHKIPGETIISISNSTITSSSIGTDNNVNM